MKRYLLALETSTHVAGCALVNCDTGGVRAHTLPEAHQASASLMRSVRQLMDAESVGMEHLVGLATSIGPGRFTGVRLGMMLAQSMAYAHGCPVVPINTMAVLAHNMPNTQAPVLLVEDAFMNEVFWAQRLPGQSLSAPQRARPETLNWPGEHPKEAWHVVGSGVNRYPEHWQGATKHPNITATPEALATLALQAFQAGECCSPEALKPLYVRDEVVAKPPTDANTAP